MNNKIKQIIENLQISNDMLYAEGAFQYYIDNQIDEDELYEVLKYNDFIFTNLYFEIFNNENGLVL